MAIGIFMLYTSVAYSQSADRCAMLNQICGTEKVQKALKLDGTNSNIELIDRDGNFRSCKSIPWGTHTASVIFDDSLSLKLRKGVSHNMFRDKCSVYIINRFEKKSKNYYLFDIIQPCSGLECEGIIRKEGTKYRLIKVNAYVQ
jgi:hypothetical protein